MAQRHCDICNARFDRYVSPAHAYNYSLRREYNGVYLSFGYLCAVCFDSAFRTATNYVHAATPNFHADHYAMTVACAQGMLLLKKGGLVRERPSE